MAEIDLKQKLEDFEEALKLFIECIQEDRNILAAVLVGSLDEDTIWRKESLYLWIIEADGVTKRLKSDGNDERIWRTLVSQGINIHVELIPRSRFKLMIEGSSRTAFSCNFFAERRLIYCADASIESWFDDANTVATKDREKELLAVTTWAIHTHRHAKKLIEIKNDLQLAAQCAVWAAHCVSAIEIVRKGEVYEHEWIYRAMELQPELISAIYTPMVESVPDQEAIAASLEGVNRYLEANWSSDLKPLLSFLKKQKRTVPLSEISDHFAYSQLYPGHLESACEWLEERGHIEKLSAPFKLTKKSRVDVEEPAYAYDG